MDMKIIDGKMVAARVKERVGEEVAEMVAEGKSAPTLACIIVEGNKASEVYVASKKKTCEALGMRSEIVRLPENVSKEELYAVIDGLNKDKGVNGILLQLPLPAHLDDVEATNQIAPGKDVDCLTSENLGKLFSGRSVVAPCTASGIMQLLENEGVEIAGKRAVVVGRSLLVGKSVANLLEQKNATVTICHSKTRDLAKETAQADILVVAIGKPKFIGPEHIKKGAVVIDVGINRTESGLLGDVDFDAVKDKVSLITPVPGGVGPMTVACLMQNCLTLTKLQQKHEKGL